MLSNREFIAAHRGRRTYPGLAAAAGQPLLTCPCCGTANFSPRGLIAHCCRAKPNRERLTTSELEQARSAANPANKLRGFTGTVVIDEAPFSPLMITIADIDARAKNLADARNTLQERVSALQDEITSARNRKLPGIKSAVVAAKEAESELEQALLAAPSLFDDSRTIVVHGLRVGFAKGRGKIEWADEASVVAKIEKLFPDQANVLVKVVKSVRKKALNGLKIDELKKLGCVVHEAGDHVYIAPVDDAVEKLVNRLLAEESAED